MKRSIGVRCVGGLRTAGGICNAECWDDNASVSVDRNYTSILDAIGCPFCRRAPDSSHGMAAAKCLDSKSPEADSTGLDQFWGVGALIQKSIESESNKCLMAQQSCQGRVSKAFSGSTSDRSRSESGASKAQAKHCSATGEPPPATDDPADRLAYFFVLAPSIHKLHIPMRLVFQSTV